MKKYFNVTGVCIPQYHYMIDISEKVNKIKKLVDQGEYFVINRARQYGKTTTLTALKHRLDTDYSVFLISFEGIEEEAFASADLFCRRVFALLYDTLCFGEVDGIPTSVKEELGNLSSDQDKKLDFRKLTEMLVKICQSAVKPVVLMIDEVDQASSHSSFITFLGCLRDMYLKRISRPAIRSVILAGVYDIKNLKLKIRADEERASNSPWNIAAKFDVDMSFSVDEIAGMLEKYERDHHLGINIKDIAGLLFEYTGGYPYLVSELCKIMDEELEKQERFKEEKKIWTKQGVLEAVKILLNETNPLFESLTGKLNDYPELKRIVYRILFEGQSVGYNPDDFAINIARMFGFVKVEQGVVKIANRIFETRLYNMFLLSAADQELEIYKQGSRMKNQFIKGNALDMELILEKFVQYFDDIYGDQDQKFYEEDGRRYFMLFLKPIINGTGNYYIEAKTRNNEQTDMIIDDLGNQYIIEMKIWHGDAYHMRGEKQLSDYLDHYHLKKGYMLSFNFNKNKNIGVKKIQLGDKELIEAVV